MLRAGALRVAWAVLLLGPAVLAFFTGGFFPSAQAWAGLLAWLLVAAAVILCERPLPRARAVQIALAGLTLLALWTTASIGWAPVAGSAYHAGQLAMLYAGVTIAAAILLRDDRVLPAVEPVLAAGALIVIGYGLSERMLPGVLQFSRSISAQGRLEQPLTYWNAMGELAALGFVLCVRLAGDGTRASWIRICAAAAGVPLLLGLYLSFSRGALFACAAGLVTLIVAAPTRAQLRSLLLVVVAGVLACAVAAPSRGVTHLAGSIGTREREGAITFVALVVLTIAAALGQRVLAGRGGATERLRLPRHAPWIALALICAGFALAVAVGSKEGTTAPLSSGTSRLETLQSNRYAYWEVALKAFAAEPLRGVGAGGWAVWWLRDRTISESAIDAHSLELQTAAELGLIGVVLLAAFLGGTAVAARSAYRLADMRAAGPIAGFVVYVAHSPLDWDWQLPAVTLVALILAGALLALGERAGSTQAQQDAGAALLSDPI